MPIDLDLNPSQVIPLSTKMSVCKRPFKINQFIFVLDDDDFYVFNDKGELTFKERYDQIFPHWSQKESYFIINKDKIQEIDTRIWDQKPNQLRVEICD